MKSIIFNQHQVNHALKNKEGMFRVVVKPQPLAPIKPFKDLGFWTNEFEIDEWISKFQVGETIFVKESWQAFTGETLGTPLGRMKIYSYPAKEGDIITYKADADLTKDFTTYRSSTTMPQWASRLTLRIKSVKVERLQDISQEDAMKSGIEKCDDSYFPLSSERNQDCCFNFKDAFKIDWNSTHKKPEEKWEANPFVFCFSYEVVR